MTASSNNLFDLKIFYKTMTLVEYEQGKRAQVKVADRVIKSKGGEQTVEIFFHNDTMNQVAI